MEVVIGLGCVIVLLIVLGVPLQPMIALALSRWEGISQYVSDRHFFGETVLPKRRSDDTHSGNEAQGICV